MPTALVTGGSSGLGLALARPLDDAGWIVVTDARDADRLRDGAGAGTTVHGVPGDVADADHRAALVERGRATSAVSTCWCSTHSTLGPLPHAAAVGSSTRPRSARCFRTNAGAPPAR